MNYIVLDLEWNQSPEGKEYENKEIPFEIIEIGAYKVDSDRNIISKFSEVIRPGIYKNIHFKTKEVIGIDIIDLQKGISFSSACKNFLDWCGDEYYFCTWGSMDLTELQRNMKYYNIAYKFPYPFFYYDLQKVFSINFEDGKSRKSLEYAVDFLEIQKSTSFHRALSDAWYAAMVLVRMDFNILHKNYSVDYYKNPKSKNEEVYVIFETYAKYISREFKTKEEVMLDKDITNTVCYKCGMLIKKKIRWFSNNSKSHYCLAYCPNHGFMKAKIRMKKAENGCYYAVKISKLVTDDQAKEIYLKREEIKTKRKLKRMQRKVE